MYIAFYYGNWKYWEGSMKYAWELWLFLVPIVALITLYVWLDR